MPASPWIGSSSTAAVVGPTAARSASASPKGTWEKPGGSGWDGAWMAGLLAAARVPQAHALAAHELHLGPRVGRPQHGRLPLRQAGHATTSAALFTGEPPWGSPDPS